MIEPQTGDFVINNEAVYEIVIIAASGYTGMSKAYTLQRVYGPGDFLDNAEHENDSCVVNLVVLQQMGKIVRKEEASKAIEMLFKR